MVKKSNETVDDVLKKHLSMLDSTDKIAKLEKESARDKKIIQELKEREKVSARALVILERKLKFLKENVTIELLKICKNTQNITEFSNEEIYDILNEINPKLLKLCNKLEEVTSISATDKAYILNKEVPLANKEDVGSRFDRLKANFDQKIGSSVLRKPGRPKKEDQSIVADIGLGKKVEKQIDESDETKSRLNEIFYGTPSSRAAVSNIPQTDDALFDFAEALNPNNSLKDIMADIMEDLSSDEKVVYSNQNIDNFISKTDVAKAKSLENGEIKKPNLHKFDELKTKEKLNVVHRNGVLMNHNIFDDIKK